jgi:hypothetical protein
MSDKPCAVSRANARFAPVGRRLQPIPPHPVIQSRRTAAAKNPPRPTRHDLFRAPHASHAPRGEPSRVLSRGLFDPAGLRVTAAEGAAAPY